uniref:Uncharacterized protein n=1 Tax=Alexandrium catenella TaxID=2925 RepID=A0A7S1LEX6_ALECA
MVILAACSPAQAARRGRGGGFLSLSTEMQPQVVAQTLVKVEDEWRAEARASAECNATGALSGAGCEGGAPRRFGKSCPTVLSAVVRASAGDRGVVQEYLDEICAQEQLKGWRSRVCQTFSFAVTAAMTADVYENREELDVASVCRDFWKGLAEDEKAIVAKERAEQEASEREEAAKKAAVAKEAAEKAAKEAAELAERRQAEEATEAQRRQAEAAAEAKRQSEEEAARQAAAAQSAAEQVSAEADERQREVEKTLAEAQHAIQETESTQAQANATNASAALRAEEEPAVQNSTNASASGVNATQSVQKN